MRRCLFVCSQNRLHRPTAQHVFADVPGIATASAGTNNDAKNPLSDELAEWADFIFVMEQQHRNKVQKKHRKVLDNKRLIALNIPDDCEFTDPHLVRLLKAKMQRWLS